jgi:hypothetical protein
MYVVVCGDTVKVCGDTVKVCGDTVNVCGDTVNQHKVIKTCIFIKVMETEKCLQFCYCTVRKGCCEL